MACKHERIAKIDKFYRCRDCGELFNEMPKVVSTAKITEDHDEVVPAKKPAKKPATKKGAK